MTETKCKLCEREIGLRVLACINPDAPLCAYCDNKGDDNGYLSAIIILQRDKLREENKKLIERIERLEEELKELRLCYSGLFYDTDAIDEQVKSNEKRLEKLESKNA